jgi:hypothetical protein
MQILIVLAYTYLGIGTLYGLYLLFSGNSTLLGLPINILGGPVMIVYQLYDVLKNGGRRRG